jgi:hypothetical protein
MTRRGYHYQGQPGPIRVDLSRWVVKICLCGECQGRPLQAAPEKLPHPRRQIEGGDPAGHVEQIRAEPGHHVPMMTQTRNT